MLLTKGGVDLGFGIELEMGLRPSAAALEKLKLYYGFDDSAQGHQSITGVRYPGPRDENRALIHRYICDVLFYNGMSAEYHEAGKAPDYTLWQIEDDPSVTESQQDYMTCIVLNPKA
jgi:hypothetical protein